MDFYDALDAMKQQQREQRCPMCKSTDTKFAVHDPDTSGCNWSMECHECHYGEHGMNQHVLQCVERWHPNKQSTMSIIDLSVESINDICHKNRSHSPQRVYLLEKIRRTCPRLLDAFYEYESALVTGALQSQVQLDHIGIYFQDAARLYRRQEYEHAADIFYSASLAALVIHEQELDQ